MTNSKQTPNSKIQAARLNFFSPWGYTLIEMLVVIAITTMTLTAVTSAILYFYRSNTVIFNQAVAVESARRALSLASADIRGARYADDGSYPVSAIATSSFTFYGDQDGDGSAERLRYFLSGTSLMRGITHASGSPATYATSSEILSAVGSDVRNTVLAIPVFRYYTATSSEITVFSTTTALSYVTMTIIVDVDPAHSPSNYTLRTTATVRNAPNF